MSSSHGRWEISVYTSTLSPIIMVQCKMGVSPILVSFHLGWVSTSMIDDGRKGRIPGWIAFFLVWSYKRPTLHIWRWTQKREPSTTGAHGEDAQHGVAKHLNKCFLPPKGRHSSSNHQFSGAILVSGRVMLYRLVLFFSCVFHYKFWCFPPWKMMVWFYSSPFQWSPK